ncbi:MAG: hypothetical protein K9J16_14005 [Melioribacteraceae bacterium]|nr:hypothetical protein [Melioribacteraceae bacterium]MCF8356341.1 hypothetical protein [Melioribacteraceae bacterium]MCF8395750.1 hypothetical protein [Melioribacteraceae bacterium]MCF8420552.1 hypothetical protein [Melioribacteraceae bacterium]
MISSNKFPLLLIFIISCLLIACDSDSPTEDDTNNTNATWQTVFFDDFNRSNGLVGNNYYAVLYIPSVSVTDTLLITDNRIKLTGELYYAVMYAHAVTNDVIRISTKFTTSNADFINNSFGISAKASYSGTDNQMLTAYSGFVDASIDSFGIFKFTDGVMGEPVAAKSFDIKKNSAYTLRLTINQGVITLEITELPGGSSETVTFNESSTALTGTGISINGMLGAGDEVYFDDFKIEKFE